MRYLWSKKILLLFLGMFFFTEIAVEEQMVSFGAPHNEREPSVETQRLFRYAKVELFVTSWCSYCRTLEAQLKKEKINFTKLDIEKSKSARATYNKLGAQGLPTVRVNSKTVIVGNDIQGIKNAILRGKKN